MPLVCFGVIIVERQGEAGAAGRSFFALDTKRDAFAAAADLELMFFNCVYEKGKS